MKNLIDKKAWPYVQNDLRLRAEYLRYDLNTVISSMPKDQKKSLKDLTGKLFQTISNVSYIHFFFSFFHIYIDIQTFLGFSWLFRYAILCSVHVFFKYKRSSVY